jgi:hypothetical protein
VVARQEREHHRIASPDFPKGSDLRVFTLGDPRASRIPSTADRVSGWADPAQATDAELAG